MNIDFKNSREHEEEMLKIREKMTKEKPLSEKRDFIGRYKKPTLWIYYEKDVKEAVEKLKEVCAYRDKNTNLAKEIDSIFGRFE